MSVLSKYRESVALENFDETEEEYQVDLPEVQEVSEDDEYTADEIIGDDVTDTHAGELQAVEDDRVMDEIQHHTVALESMMETLNYGLENQKFDPQFAHAVSDTLGRVGEALGDETPTVSIENHAADELNEFYTVSVEDIREKLDKFADIQEQIIMRALVGPFSAAVKAKRSGVADSLVKKGDALISRISELGGGTAEVSLKGMTKGLASKGTVSAQIAGQVRKDQAATAELLQKFGPAALEYCSTLYTQLNEVIKHQRGKDKEQATTKLKGLAALKLPENSISSGILDGSSLIGNAYLNLKKTNQWAEVTERQAPRFKKHSGTSGPATVKVSKSDLLALANAVKAYGVVMKAANDDLTNKASKAKTNVASEARDLRMKREGGWWLPILKRNAEFQALWKLCRAYPMDTASVINGSFAHGRSSAQTVAKFVDRGITALKKADK